MLVLNAGIGIIGPFDWLSNDEIQNQVTINVNHVAYTAKALVSQMLKRVETTGKKAGCIVTSSVAGLTPLSGFSVYSATKAFDDFIAKALTTEFKGQIDMLSFNPGFVNTNFSQDEELKAKLKNCGMITPEYAAHCCLRDMGYSTNSTKGAFMHKMDLMPILPRACSQNLSYKMAKG